MKINLIRICLSILIFSASSAMAEDVAIIMTRDIPAMVRVSDSFKSFLAAKGISIRSSLYNMAQSDEATIVNQVNTTKPDLVLAIGTSAAELCKRNIRSIPVMYSMVLNSSSYSRPNMTGITLEVPGELKLKKLGSLLPDRRRIGIIYSSRSRDEYQSVAEVASKLGYTIISKSIDSSRDFIPTLRDMGAYIDMFLMVTDNDIYDAMTIKGLFLESMKNRFPIIGLTSYFTKAGAAISIESDYIDIGHQLGEIAMQIFNGRDPGSIKPAPPRRISYSLNKLTSGKLGLQLSGDAYNNASEVFGQ